MSEEISKQYEKGLVDLMSIVEPLIDKFKADKNSIDIQQLQLVTEYLITDRELDENYIDELEVKLDKEKLNSLNLSEQLNKEKEKNKKIEDKIKKTIKEIERRMNLANECIEQEIVIADSDSLNYGRAQAHDVDRVLLMDVVAVADENKIKEILE